MLRPLIYSWRVISFRSVELYTYRVWNAGIKPYFQLSFYRTTSITKHGVKLRKIRPQLLNFKSIEKSRHASIIASELTGTRDRPTTPTVHFHSTLRTLVRGLNRTVKSFFVASWYHWNHNSTCAAMQQGNKTARERERERKMKRVLKVNRLSEWKWLSAERSRWILSLRLCPGSVMRKTGGFLFSSSPSLLPSLASLSLSLHQKRARWDALVI